VMDALIVRMRVPSRRPPLQDFRILFDIGSVLASDRAVSATDIALIFTNSPPASGRSRTLLAHDRRPVRAVPAVPKAWRR